MDIEDVIGLDDGGARRTKGVAEIKIRTRKIKDIAPEEVNVESFVPGTQQKVWVRTWGCSHNTSDSEYMSGLLQKAGYNIVKNEQEADVWVLNSCTVKTPSEQQANNLLTQGQNDGKKIIMAGCVSQAAPNEPWLQDCSIVGVKQIDRIVEVVEETLKGNKVRLLTRNRPDAPLALPKMRKNQLIEVLSISTGCLNNCTYCKTKMARGDLVSYPLNELVEQARRSFVDEGVKEVWLTSEDLGAWGRDIGHTLPDLLNELVKVIPDGCMMRLGMTNPPYILDHLEEIAEILNHPRVYSFLHIPVQSASDAVLNDMKREYSRRHFEQIVDYMIENVPNIYIATDMILAFPTENVEDFEESMDLVRKYQFPSLFINQYYPRSGTPAARLKKIDTIEARRRTGLMSELFRDYTRYPENRIGEIHDVLVTEIAADKVHGVGHNKCYEQILVPLSSCEMGKWVRVKITSVTKFSMISEILTDSSTSSSSSSFSFVLPVLVLLFTIFLLVKIAKTTSSTVSTIASSTTSQVVGGSSAATAAATSSTCLPTTSTVSHQNERVIEATNGRREISRWKSREGANVKPRERDNEGYRKRAAALCIKGVGDDTHVLLVSAGKDGGKWVVPGGGVEKNECAEEAAHRELMEEAGVRAHTLRNIGLFQDDVRKHRTQVFLMEVLEEKATWEENEFGRQRIWMPIGEGTEKVKNSHRAILEAVLSS
ncbi:unnamed protein product [Caenorhabditis angaria]|uniref:Threonylcarbamoyladenosine tRNA methylthiotransferase n=1 Tax=Caenorhabditis angaria TaxID=860376 RepID=A0A9P1I4Z4_9PELO|nr:unnamed protein product [Caenorhabditis angaria]